MTKPPDLSRMKAEAAKAEHKAWCQLVTKLGSIDGPWECCTAIAAPRCTCGLSAMRERIERIEGMAMDAGKESN